MGIFRSKIILASCLVVWPVSAQADGLQENSQIVLDESPYVTTRAAGMGGALSTLAEGVDAPYYNPAGIGGLDLGNTKQPTVRHLNFPYIGASLNENASKIVRDPKSSASPDESVSDGINNAITGKRQYGRGSAMMNIVVGHMMLLVSDDTQLAAFKEPSPTDGQGQIAIGYREQTTTGLGFSMVNPKETFHLGLFSSYNTRKLFTGSFDYTELDSEPERHEVIASNSKSFHGVSTNLGILWIMSKRLRPALGIVLHDIGNTNYSSGADDAVDPAQEKFIAVKQNATVGFSISPQLGRFAIMNFIVEEQDIGNRDVAVNKKFHTGLEFTFFGHGSEAPIGIRTGYNLAGVSYGLNFNLGLIQVEVASSAQDIGIGNLHVVERRNSAVFSVNLRDD